MVIVNASSEYAIVIWWDLSVALLLATICLSTSNIRSTTSTISFATYHSAVLAQGTAIAVYYYEIVGLLGVHKKNLSLYNFPKPINWSVIPYLVQHWHVCQNDLWLHSALSMTPDVWRTRPSAVGDRAFPVAAAHLWNSLPSHVSAAPPLSLHLLLSS